MGKNNEEREEQPSLALWEFVRFRKEHLVLLWCSDLLAGHILKLLEEEPGNSEDGELQWGQRQWALTLAPGEGSFSFLPDIPILPQSGWTFLSGDNRLVSSLICLGQARTQYKQKPLQMSTIQPIPKDFINMRVSLELVFKKKFSWQKQNKIYGDTYDHSSWKIKEGALLVPPCGNEAEINLLKSNV
uniref:Uncharacterized protein n=1 Tax=Molossus molossus TaxID=27622 RepID=A0A7J8CZX6_MOLMO|nr:hypothetical protein HJG59_009519 [Molossus molossus]